MKYWVYINGEVPGCFTPPELVKLPEFSITTLICPAEGEILEKNWRRAGEFQDLMPFLQDAAHKSHPAPPPAPPRAADVDALIDTASNRLFSHVADLMKELENRREERAMVLSLQRQILDLKAQLHETREKAREATDKLDASLPRLNELEESKRKDDEKIQTLEAALQGRNEAMAELRIQLETTKTELETVKRRYNETANDLTIRNRLVDKLSHDLTDKEVNLAKALGVIRRLEEDLNRLCPETPDAPKPPAPPEPEPAQEAKPAEPDLPRASYTTDEPERQPPVIAPPTGQPQAHSALLEFFKRFTDKTDS